MPTRSPAVPTCPSPHHPTPPSHAYLDINTAMFHAWLLIAGHAWASWRGLGSGTPGLATGTWLVVQVGMQVGGLGEGRGC